MEKGILKKGSTATINGITLFNQHPIERKCSPGCGKMFKTTEGGPRICPECRKKLKKLKKLKTSSRRHRVRSSPNGRNGIGGI
ncbi:MAG: hypothetical protein COU42_01050 [Candidatus Nealsonbacteria bacterium CG10_big_fil_rev_8_21_14_0_10_36_24]|uniref:Uncharacterized protein n=1 Tax=Candidatus Nealsonbacteria bacterium CG10_big_fil_rev_8_21_14_0_10_36_24 TaxID=1974710 RepID=A0A2M6NT56_9BACT|nr:MAG: hypothetical protein COU42_01050 [Candidatus Nealsonbacteria bacterium CG10_big_fil_rev_8_21_14_0_10_36_24]